LRSKRKPAARKAKAKQPKPFTGASGDDAVFDPFSPISPPKGKSYQWFAIEVMGERNDRAWKAIAIGSWKPVPFRRHSNELPKTFNVKGRIVRDGLMLCERAKELTDAAIDRSKNDALEMMKAQRELFGFDRDPNEDRYHRGPIPIMNAGWVESQPYDRVHDDAPFVDIAVTIRVRLPARLQDAASALKLTNEMYAQRMIELHARGDIGGLLLPMLESRDIPAVYELKQIYLNDHQVKN
jgi:hypothetical protein